MERQLQREHVLLGAAPRDPFASPDPSVGLSRRRSDVEFDDVFGGPPTRFAIYSRRHSLEESRDANSPRVSGGSEQEEDLQSRRPWNSLGEKPVFGEAFSPSSRRRGLGDDFFNDIFRGSDSACSTPRMLDRDAFSSTPGSRLLSPARPLPPRPDSFSSTPGSRVLSPARSFPPRNEPLTGTSSLQSPLSLPQKMTEVLDYPTFGSSRDLGINENEDSVLGAVTSMASIPEVVSGNQDDWRTDPHTSFYQSDLSFRYSLDEEIIQEANHSAAANIEARGRENSTNSKDNSRNNQFHFSIYKWASRGVMLVLPSNLKERDKTKGRLSELPVPFLQGVDLPPNNKNMPAREKVFPSDLVKDEKSLLSEVYTENQDSEDFTKPMDRTSPSKLQPVPSPADVTKKQGIPTEPPEVESGNMRTRLVQGNIYDDISIFLREQPTPQNLRDLLNDQYSSEDVKQVKERENVSGNDIFVRSADNLVEIKRQTIKKTVSDLSDAQDVSVSLEGKTQPGRVKGKVKEFIKIFNQDISCKPMNRRQSPRVQDLGNYKVEDHANVYRIKMEEILADEKLDFDLSPDDKKTPEFPQEKNEASAPSFESTIENVEVVYADIEEPHYEVEECVVESLLEEYNELPQTDKSVEEFQNPDVKIREWSAGKEGNIRSLLSTLQYVLWPGSGWKPVPLVDVIEGASVKRAYQRALLCLHPDKLQQRGAPAHQKYIAAKVFDILQDAWSEFNSVGNLL